MTIGGNFARYTIILVETSQFHQNIGVIVLVPPILMVETYAEK
jgi:hypothetical protein